jgi:hypothetical protein
MKVYALDSFSHSSATVAVAVVATSVTITAVTIAIAITVITVIVVTANDVNCLTLKFVQAGTKNSRLEGFLLAKHKHTNITTMMEPFAPPVAWFCCSSLPHPWEPLRKGLAEAFAKGIWYNQ